MYFWSAKNDHDSVNATMKNMKSNTNNAYIVEEINSSYSFNINHIFKII